MFDSLFFCMGDEATVRSVEELRQALADELGHACSAEFGGEEKQLIIAEFGLTLLLVFDDNGELSGATMKILRCVNLHHVAELCRAFRNAGWDFWTGDLLITHYPLPPLA